ncbi:MAG: two-component system response regulator [Candidatus Rokuibacteriota bacterium]|nr:MAG: two-component system response regulator [Candidatus Rokubacteria bacterium]
MGQQREVLIVDDDRQVREVLHQIFLGAGYKCLLANDGQEGVEVFRASLRASRPPLTVTDLKMPVMGGIELLQLVREADPDAAVIILTGAADVKTAIASLKHGAYDFIMKPVNVDELLIAADRALERRQLLIERRHYQELLERRVDEATRGLAQLNRELQDAYQTTLEALGSALDTRDVGTESHSRRVHGYAMATAREYGVPQEDLAALAHGVLLHDIGKIGIPDAILLKPGPLTPDEWQIMRRHPEIGKQLIEKIPFLQGAVPIVYSHHEKWDGTGYPRGLRGEDIPLGARIFMVVDAFDAITFDRPYSKAQPFDVAKAEIKRCAGKHFDPDVVTAFFNVPEALLAEIRRKSVEP